MRCILIPILLISLLGCEEQQKEKKAKAYLHDHIKKTLRDPASFKVYDEKVEMDGRYTYILTIDYGAKNGYGGMERRTEKFSVTGDLVLKKTY